MASFTPGPSGAVALPQPLGGDPPPYSAAIEAGAVPLEKFVPGRTDDDAAFADAIAFAKGRPIMLAGRPHSIGNLQNGRFYGQGTESTVINALTANAGIVLGNPVGQAPLNSGGGGFFSFDGKNLSTQGVLV